MVYERVDVTDKTFQKVSQATFIFYSAGRTFLIDLYLSFDQSLTRVLQ